MKITIDIPNELIELMKAVTEIATESKPPLSVVRMAQPAPVAPVAQLAPVAPEADVDQFGTPFDPAIHSSAHKLNKDGTWKARRGTKAVAPAPAPAPAPTSTEISFPLLMQTIKQKGVSDEDVQALAVKYGMSNIFECSIHPEITASILGEINA